MTPFQKLRRVVGNNNLSVVTTLTFRPFKFESHFHTARRRRDEAAKIPTETFVHASICSVVALAELVVVLLPWRRTETPICQEPLFVSLVPNKHQHKYVRRLGLGSRDTDNALHGRSITSKGILVYKVNMQDSRTCNLAASHIPLDHCTTVVGVYPWKKQ